MYKLFFLLSSVKCMAIPIAGGNCGGKNYNNLNCVNARTATMERAIRQLKNNRDSRPNIEVQKCLEKARGTESFDGKPVGYYTTPASVDVGQYNACLKQFHKEIAKVKLENEQRLRNVKFHPPQETCTVKVDAKQYNCYSTQALQKFTDDPKFKFIDFGNVFIVYSGKKMITAASYELPFYTAILKEQKCQTFMTEPKVIITANTMGEVSSVQGDTKPKSKKNCLSCDELIEGKTSRGGLTMDGGFAGCGVQCGPMTTLISPMNVRIAPSDRSSSKKGKKGKGKSGTKKSE